MKKNNNILNIILPVYNEISTVNKTIKSLLNLKLKDYLINLLIVESNSIDGSRDVVKKYIKNNSVKIILQDKPLGKGNAVREALTEVSSGIVMIFDADDEYDIEDVPNLLSKFNSNKVNFVLGSRHSKGKFMMRKFNDQKFSAFVLNIGHWFFTYLINCLYLVNLKDPFTMYKLFRYECIKNLYFECNRFDFDHELVIKLIRSGVKPIEVPVSYQSRSFTQGKKIEPIRDSLSWIKAIFKYRFSKIYK